MNLRELFIDLFYAVLSCVTDTLRGVDSHERLTFITGFGMVIDAWELVVKLMCVGEKSAIRCSSRIAYGEKGLDDTIPPNQDQEYTIELLEIGQCPKYTLMNEEELSEFVLMVKDRGNFYFNRKEYEKAIFVYKRASSIIEVPDDCEPLRKLFSALHSNLAVCYSKLDDLEKVLECTEESLRLHSANTKALFRRAGAFAARKETERAIECLDRALLIDPSDSAILCEMDRLSGVRRRRRVEERLLYKKMLAGAGDDVPLKVNWVRANGLRAAIATFSVIMFAFFIYFLLQIWVTPDDDKSSGELIAIVCFRSPFPDDMSFPLLLLLPVFCLTSTEPLNCPSTDIPTRLAAVSVWLRQTNSSSIYRLSDEDLTEEGYKRSTADRDNMVVMFARDSGQCSIGTCAVRLNTNRRNSDAYAYSLDPAATFPNYTRDPKILCYGWADGGSVVHPLSTEYHCVRLQTIANAKITYSSTGSNFFPVGTTATLSCDDGYKGGGQSTVLCTHSGWYPSNGLGFCVEQNVTSGGMLIPCFDVIQPLNGIVTYSGFGTSSTLECPNPVISNGFITYSQSSASESTKPVGTTATLTCNFGFSSSGSTTSTCFSGTWSPVLSSCIYNSSGSMNQQCSAIFAPLGATVMYSTGSSFGPFNSGTTVTITCPTGTSVPVSTCSNGQWQPPTPTSCSSIPVGGIGQSCSSMTAPFGVILTYSSGVFGPYNSGTVVTASCSSGEIIQGASTATCTNGQWSPMTLGTCGAQTGSGITCSSIIESPGSRIDYSDNLVGFTHQSGTTATLVCTVGMPMGVSRSTCMNGQWSPPIGSCSGTSTNGSGLQCVFGTTVSFGGTVTYSNGNSFGPWPDGSTATLNCPVGQYPQGSSVAYCTNGIWSNLGTCGTSTGSAGCNCTTSPGIINGAMCAFGLITPLNGNITYSSGIFPPYPAGTVATLSCLSNYWPSGTTTSVCSNGTFPALGNSNGCNPLAPVSTIVENGYTVYRPAVKVSVVTGTVVNVYCNPGFILYGYSELRCTANGWQPPVPGQCFSQGMSIKNEKQGTTATVSCNLGFTISGASTAQCQNGIWTPSSLGTCISGFNGGSGSQCMAGLPSTTNGIVTYTNNQPFAPWPAGTTASLTCNTGYLPSGSSSSVCQYGHWVPPTLGQCIFSQFGGMVTRQCQAVPFVSRGTVSYSQLSLPPYAEGTTASLLCNLGTTPLGQQTVTCQGGTWVPFPGLGICQGALARAPTTLNDYKNSNSSVHPNTFCPPPKAPPFGEVTFSLTSDEMGFKEGTTAALRCKLGYSITGASFSTCRNGSFRPLLGKCSDGNISPVPGACTPISPPLNGRITYIQSNQTSNFEKGTTALLYCEHSFSVTGQATLTCSDDGWVPNNGFGQCIKSTK
uniref:peptidylprolyl isomerase n=1 Tax=Heterorhabditis bacteriophora TaxID=37862 RepID=A0A1I7XPL6_HETBA